MGELHGTELEQALRSARAELEQREQEHRSHLRFLESLEQVDRVIRRAGDLQRMMQDVLDAALAIFGCDRAWLLYPCDPEASTFRVPMERTRPEWPGALAMGIDLPASPEAVEAARLALASPDPVIYDPRSGRAVPFAERFSTRSQIILAVHPRQGPPWTFGLHQCSHARIWTEDDARLLKEVGHRVADGLSSLLFLADLRESERRYRALAEAAREMVFVLGRHGRVEYVNTIAAQHLGRRPEEIVGMPRELLFPSPASARQQQAIANVFESGTPSYIESDTPFPGGALWLGTWLVPLRDDAGTVTAVLGVSRDMTERKRAEEALFESRQMLRLVLDTIPQRVFWKDRSSVYLGCNRPMALDCGYGDPVELVGKTDHETASAANAELYRADDRQVMETGLPKLGYEERQIKPDGSPAWLRTSKVPLRDQDGRVIGVLGTYEDITERKRTAEALEASERRVRDFVEHALVGVYRATPDGQILMANPALARLLGYPSLAALAGVNLARWAEDHDYPRSALLQTLDREGTVSGFESRYTQEDGTEIHLRESARAVRNEAGEIAYYEGTVEDLTMQRVLEAQLLQAQKMEAVGRLAGGMAHDFNNLLVPILGYSEMLLDRLDPASPAREHVAEIRRAGESAASLTRQLLAFSRRQVSEPQVLSPNAVVREFERMLRRLLEESIELRLDLAPEVSRVRLDPGHLEQILVNLVVNARDAMPDGGTLTISTADVDLDDSYARLHIGVAPGRCIRLSVSDTGSGIDPAALPHIFEPFFTTKARGKGTGLGLSTVYGIVHQAGGHVVVESVPGQGTVVEVHLPRAEARAEPVSTKPVAGVRRGSETILLVEDEEPVRALASRVLRESGYAVVEARNAEEALAIAATDGHAVHLLLTDSVMPGLSGPRLAQHLKERFPRLKVLVMSGYTEEPTPVDGVSQSRYAYLQKPFTPAQLTEKVRRVLDGEAN